MALNPIDEQHALQIQAGIIGRKAGHKFEDALTAKINLLTTPFSPKKIADDSIHVFVGEPERIVLDYICSKFAISEVKKVTAISTGVLATSEEGKKWLDVNGIKVTKCKSDVILNITSNHGKEITVGISTKQCNNKTPTNAQLYFTTARGFCELLRNNGFEISSKGELALRQFCGDAGFRPQDNASLLIGRKIDPRRFFWEEINKQGRSELEKLFTEKQDEITLLLFQKAYLDDPFAPDFVLHKTKRAESWGKTETALYTVDEIVMLSRRYNGFNLKPYSVRKGRYKDPLGITHLAPRFGIVQMQRGGQKQHPNQLQFNLGAGYFYKI